MDILLEEKIFTPDFFKLGNGLKPFPTDNKEIPTQTSGYSDTNKSWNVQVQDLFDAKINKGSGSCTTINKIPSLKIFNDKIITGEGKEYPFSQLPPNVQKLISNENDDNSLNNLNSYYQQEYNRLIKLKNKYSIADLVNFIDPVKKENIKFTSDQINDWGKELKTQEKLVGGLKQDINKKIIHILNKTWKYIETITKLNPQEKQCIEKQGKFALFPVSKIMTKIHESQTISPHSNYLTDIWTKKVKRYYPKYQSLNTKFYWEKGLDPDLKKEKQKLKKEKLPLCFTSLGRDIDRAIHELLNCPPYYRLFNTVEISLKTLVKDGLDKEPQTKILEQVWKIIQDLTKWHLVYEFKQKNETMILIPQPLYSIEECFITRNKTYPDSIILKHNFYHLLKPDETPLHPDKYGQPGFGHNFILFNGTNITRKGFGFSLLLSNQNVGKKGRGELKKLDMLDDLIRKKIRSNNNRTFGINEIELAERTGFSITSESSDNIRKLRSRLKVVLEKALQNGNTALKEYKKRESLFTSHGKKQIEYILTAKDNIPCGGEIRAKHIEKIKRNNSEQGDLNEHVIYFDETCPIFDKTCHAKILPNIIISSL